MIRTILIAAVLMALIGVVGWVGFKSYREMERNDRIQEEIQALEKEKSRIQQENSLLQDRIEYLKTDTFQRQEAKEKLNYREAGEKVVIIKQVAGVAEKAIPESSYKENRPEVHFQVPNFRKWWRQFFG